MESERRVHAQVNGLAGGSSGSREETRAAEAAGPLMKDFEWGEGPHQWILFAEQLNFFIPSLVAVVWGRGTRNAALWNKGEEGKAKEGG